jgi:CheY-like chemotaxis protein
MPKIILLTSSEKMVSRDEMNAHNILEFLSKPIKQSELYNKIISTFFEIENKTELKEEKPEITEEKYSLKVLIAEDNIINQRVANSLFSKLGCQVVIANDGMEAIEKAQNETFDLIFMDMQMPNMDGLEASVKLRELGISTPIIALTANAVKGDMEKCIESGMNDYLSKPVQKKGIIEKIEKWM